MTSWKAPHGWNRTWRSVEIALRLSAPFKTGWAFAAAVEALVSCIRRPLLSELRKGRSWGHGTAELPSPCWACLKTMDSYHDIQPSYVRFHHCSILCSYVLAHLLHTLFPLLFEPVPTCSNHVPLYMVFGWSLEHIRVTDISTKISILYDIIWYHIEYILYRIDISVLTSSLQHLFFSAGLSPEASPSQLRTAQASDPDLEEAELTDQEASDWFGLPRGPSC